MATGEVGIIRQLGARNHLNVLTQCLFFSIIIILDQGRTKSFSLSEENQLVAEVLNHFIESPLFAAFDSRERGFNCILDRVIGQETPVFLIDQEGFSISFIIPNSMVACVRNVGDSIGYYVM